ncbi:MAG: hypothetical protein DWQ02_24870 [Bacteroidetes bacterium]|nr:MAG: hypothetical protein DWQ02_24870 [Bacteroidota bacterium]
MANETKDYVHYHQQVLKAEQLITKEKFDSALKVYDGLMQDYDFVFLKEYQVAAQLALYLGDTQKAINLIKKGILRGWEWKSIRKNDFFTPLRGEEDWKKLKKNYRQLHQQYLSSLNNPLRKRVKKLFSKDQWKAFGALFTFSSKAQDRYAEKKFAPHSERQLSELRVILRKYGYPGEQLTGNNYWASTILSHHNSISLEYGQKDTLYQTIKPELEEALKRGQISPFEMALIDEWYRTVQQHKTTYGILNPPSRNELTATNDLRAKVYMRSIETRNKLIEIQERTGMSFYLEGGPWVDGEIDVVN